jgi:protein-glutamine gamma-glutamyltransferase
MKLESPCIIKWYSATLGVAAGAVLYAYLGFGPVLPGVLAIAVASYFIVSAVRQTDEADSPYQKVSEGIAGLGIAAFLPLIFMADFLIALVIFLGFAQLALNFQTHDYRRFYLGIFVSFVCISVGASVSKSGFYLVFFLAYSLCAGMTIGYAAMARRRPGQPLQWDWVERTRIGLLLIIAAVGLYLILPRLPAGDWFAQPGSDHFYYDKKWEAEAKQHKGIHVRQCIETLKESQSDRQDGGAPGAVAEESAGSHSKSRGTNGRNAFHYDGFQKQFDINNPARRGQCMGNGIVVRMRADHSQYLRARIFDLFDGLHWRSSSDQTVKLAVGFNGVDLIAPDHYTSTVLQTYEIFIERDLDDHIAAAAVPVQLKFPATAVGVDKFGQLRSPGPLKKGTAYAVTSQYHVRHGRLFAELDHQPLPTYTQLPDSLAPRIAALAREVTQGSPNQLRAAIALERHLRTSYQYNLDSALTSQGTTPIAKFLFETKSGHCEYFASALAVMLRTQNIPSRLVTGFSATNRNPLTGYYDIHALDAHAWVEALVDDEGWVVLEPTPYFDGPLPEESRLSAHQINDFVEHEMRRRKALGQNRHSLAAILNTIWHLLYVFVSAALGYIKLFILVSWPWMTACLAAAFGIWFTWRRYRHLWRAHRIHRRVAVYTGDDPRLAVTFYLTAIDDLLKLAGFQSCPGDTIEHYLRRLEPIAGVRSDPALATAFNRIYYNREAGDRQSVPLYKQLFQRLYEAVLHDRHSMGGGQIQKSSL